MTNAETLESLIRETKFKSLSDFLLNLAPAERSDLKPLLRKLLPKARRDEDFATRQPNCSQSLRRIAAYQAARLAAVAILEFSDLKKLRWSDDGEAQMWTAHWEPWRVQNLRILKNLRPSWIQDYADLLLTQHINHWFFVRRMIRLGLCATPTIPQYIFGMATELRWRWSSSDVNEDFGTKDVPPEEFIKNNFRSLREALLDDANLLKDAIWKLFDYEGDSRCSLSSLEAGIGPEDSWRETLIALANEKIIPRERLLDRCLDAVARDFKPYYAAWFLGLHKSLKPTPTELVARKERYLHILGASNPATVKLALDSLAAIQNEKSLEAATLIDAIEPVFRLTAKATIVQSLRLLAASIRTNPDLASRALEIASTALLNESPEVQSAVLDLFEKNPQTVPDLSLYRDSVAASNRERFNKLSAPSDESPAVVATEPPPLSHPLPTPIVPIENLDELLDRASYVLENPEDIVQLERVLDGLSRLCHLRRPDMPQYAGALLAKCKKTSDRDSAATYRSCIPVLGNLLRNWIENTTVFADGLPDDPSFDSFLVRRILSLRKPVAAGVSMPLLSALVTTDGWIDARTLIERATLWLSSIFQIHTSEAVAALLRLSREGRPGSLADAKDLPGEFGDAVRYVLGDDTARIGPTAPIWIAAARARYPNQDDTKVNQAHPGYGPDAALIAHYAWEIYPTGYTTYPPFERIRIIRRPDSPRTNYADFFSVLPSDAFNGQSETFLYFYPEDVIAWRWASQIWPDCSEPFLANGVRLLANHADTSAKEYFKILRSLFEILHRPHTQLGPMAYLFLAFAALAKSSEIRNLAADALIHLINAKKFEPTHLANPIAQLTHTKSYFYGGRLRNTLQPLTRLTPSHSQAAAHLIDVFLSSSPNPNSRELNKLFELFYELTVLTRHLVSPEAKSFLHSLPPTPKIAKLIKS